MRRGAFDFIPKPFTPDQIRAVLAKVAKAHSLERRLQALENDLGLGLAAGRPRIRRAGDGSVPCRWLSGPPRRRRTSSILGPSGTGKSVLAREIHKRSARREEAFVTVNCPSLSRELLESELFGHARGSFTGAVAETAGKVAAADGGTLFLDEIGEMPLEIQPKLLRLLQEREYERVGEALPRRADVRVIAATNRDLGAEVKARPFPRGPLLPAERDCVDPAGLARASGRPGATRRGHAQVFRPARRKGADRVLPGRLGGLRPLPVAGQPARAAQRDRAGGHPRAG